MGSSITLWAPLVLLIVVMWFLMIRPQRKREKEVNAMRSNLHVGDEIVTIGGICGKIVKTKEESIVLQVGGDKVKMELMRWSVSKVVNPGEARNAQKEEPEESAEEDVPKKSTPKRMKKAQEEAKELVQEEAADAVEAVETEATEGKEAVADAAEAAEKTVADVAEAAEETVTDAADQVDKADA